VESQQASVRPRVVDYQCHWWPPAFIEWLEQREEYPRARRTGDSWVVSSGAAGDIAGTSAFADLDGHIALADAEAIDVMVLGAAGLGEVMHLPIGEAVEVADRLNREYAQAQERHPDRIVALASLPMQDIDAALEVLDRAVAMGLAGISLLASNNDEPVARRETLPIYRRLAELDLPVVLHPGFSGNMHMRGSWRLLAGLGWMYQSAAAALTLIDSGTLDELTSLTIVVPHLGGMLPFVYERVESIPGGDAKRPIREYLRQNFYVDIVGPTPGALQLAIRTYGLAHVVFGTDYPYVMPAETKQWLAENATPEEEATIYSNRVPNLRVPDAAAR
jgi:aminocarboxymuconate-semialdehyde decarboxylase